jgi:hypothetical protein
MQANLHVHTHHSFSFNEPIVAATPFHHCCRLLHLLVSLRCCSFCCWRLAADGLAGAAASLLLQRGSCMCFSGCAHKRHLCTGGSTATQCALAVMILSLRDAAVRLHCWYDWAATCWRPASWVCLPTARMSIACKQVMASAYVLASFLCRITVCHLNLDATCCLLISTCRSPAVCAAAAAGGHTHVLAWLREQVRCKLPTNGLVFQILAARSAQAYMKLLVVCWAAALSVWMLSMQQAHDTGCIAGWLAD